MLIKLLELCHFKIKANCESALLKRSIAVIVKGFYSPQIFKRALPKIS